MAGSRYGAGKIQPNNDNSPVVAADDLANAAFVVPPLSGGPVVAVPVDWNTENFGAVAEFDVNMWASTASTMSVGEVLGAHARAQAIPNDAVDTVDFANNELDIAAHVYSHGDGPLQMTTTTTVPAGLALTTDYWVIVVSAGTIQLATTLANAVNGTAVAFTDGGTGTHTLEDTADTKRLRWQSMGFLGNANDGAHVFSDDKGLTKRFAHRSSMAAYMVDGAFTAGGISVEFEPIRIR